MSLGMERWEESGGAEGMSDNDGGYGGCECVWSCGVGPDFDPGWSGVFAAAGAGGAGWLLLM